MQILLVEHRSLALKRALERKGFKVETAKDSTEADRRVRAHAFGVIILDLEAVADAASALVKRWRRDGVHAHIVVLTEQAGAESNIHFLSLGADDCVVKPYDIDDLANRLHRLAGTAAPSNDDVFAVFDMELNASERTVQRAGLAVRLTSREFDLLFFLAQHRGKPVSRALIRDQVYGKKSQSNVVDVCVRNLRRKIDDGFDFPLILTCRGKGYMLRGDDQPPGEKTS